MYEKCALNGRGAFPWCVCVRLELIPTVVFIAVQTNVARNAFRGFTLIQHHITLFEIISLAQFFD